MHIAHVSDLHLLSLDGVALSDFANKRWLGGLNLIVNRGRHHVPAVFSAMVDDMNALGVDHILCTGDITNLALESEFLFAKGHFDRIAKGPDHVTCIPGNHDSYIAEVSGLFESVFDPFCRADEDWQWSGGSRWPVVRVRGDVAIVALSSSVPTAWLMAYGQLGVEQLLRLERALSDPRLADKCRVVMIHHPPAGHSSANPLRGLRDRDALATVLERAGAELVLHGHEHRNLEGSLRGPKGAIPVHGVTSGTYSGAGGRLRARYRLYEVKRRGDQASVVSESFREWQPDTKRFAQPIR